MTATINLIAHDDLVIANVKNFGAVGDGSANDTAAIQAAIDSGKGSPVTVYFPPGTYKVYPPNTNGAPCLAIHYDNITMVGCGPAQSIIKCYVSGGRDPNTNFDALNWGVGQSVWRGPGILIRGNASDPGARATTSASSGKLYFEWTIGASGAGPGVGLSTNNLGYQVTDFLSSSGAAFLGGINSVSVFGPVFINSFSQAFTLGTVHAGDVLAIAVDVTNKLFWTKNITQGSFWNANGAADPAAGTGGANISSISTPMFPTADLESGSVTLNLGTSPFTGTVPAGFSAWPSGTWNSSDMDNVYLTLSNGNNTVTRTLASGGGRQHIVFDSLRITGNCLRSTATWPFGGTDPPFQPALTMPNGDGWDISHHGLHFDNDAPNNDVRVFRCEVDGFKGEIIYGSVSDMQIRQCHLHDTNADVMSFSGTPNVIADSYIHDGTNIIENSLYNLDLMVERNYCINVSGGFIVTNQTVQGGDVSINGRCVIRDNVLVSILKYSVFIQNYANQVWITGNTFVDCGFTVQGLFVQLIKSNTNPYPGANLVIEDNQFFSYQHALAGIYVEVVPGSLPITQMFVRRNTFMVTPFSQPGGGFNFGVTWLLQPGCILFVEDNDCNEIKNGSGAFVDANPGVGQALLRRNVGQAELPYPERVMLYTQFNKNLDTALDNVGMTTQLAVGGIYTFVARLYVSANASGGAKVAVKFSGTPSEFFALAKLYTGTAISASGSSTTNGASLAGATAAVDMIDVSGYITCSSVAANAGSLDVQFAQNASFGTSSSVLKGSYLSICESQYLIPPTPIPTAFDPAHTATPITLSGSNLVATITSTPDVTGDITRSVASHSVGKFYCEFTATTIASNPGSFGVGILNASQAITNAFLGNSGNNSIAAYGDTSFWLNNASIGTWASSTEVDGDVICMAVDFSNSAIWWRKNGSNWNNNGAANPATNTGGQSIAALNAGPYFAAANLATLTQKCSANFGSAAYSFTPPSGFGNW